MVKISVVIPTFNRSDLLRCCLNSLVNQSLKKKFYEIIIVDDGSADDTKKVIAEFKRKFGNLVYLYQENSGHSVARNKGFSVARGRIIASTDDDCIIPNTWLEDILRSFYKRPGIVAVGGGLINKDKDKFNRVTFVLNFSKWFPSERKQYVPDIPTANIAYKKEKIKNLKFQDDKKSLGYRDSLFNYTLFKMGERILFDPKISVAHRRQVKMDYTEFLVLQRRKALGFIHGGHKVHGFVGRLLFTFRFLNLFCPRLFLVFLRCIKTRKHFSDFIKLFPWLFRGEFERGWTIMNYKKHV